MSLFGSSGRGALVLLLAAVVGACLGLYAYLTPLTGVTGTIGALIAVGACVILAVLALLLAASQASSLRGGLRFVILLGLLETALAGALLHQWGIVVAMAVGLAGLILDAIRPSLHSTGRTAA